MITQHVVTCLSRVYNRYSIVYATCLDRSQVHFRLVMRKMKQYVLVRMKHEHYALTLDTHLSVSNNKYSI